jgi:flavin-dependent dehydrogenase
MALENGSRVAVIGGGPAGSLFSYFLLDLAERMDIDIKVDIYEPRDFSLPAPKGCNMCAGVISESLVQNLATEGINFPDTVIRKAVGSYVMHTEFGSQMINAAAYEKRIGTMFRGGGPRGIQESHFHSFDDYLLSLSTNKGANVVNLRVTSVEKIDGLVQVRTSRNTDRYDLLVVAAGVNTAVLKLFEEGGSKYRPPETTNTALREYYLGRETIEKTFAGSLHVFLLDIPRLTFGMIVPKDDYVSVCMLGKDIDETLVRDFLTAPAVKNCFPEDWRWDQPNCHCSPRINVRAAVQPYADRVVFIGDSGVTRLYKDGIGAAYRAAKSAAACAVLHGVSSEDFRRHYGPFCRRVVLDNQFGKLIFLVTHIIQRTRFARNALLKIMAYEQKSPSQSRRMSSVIWDMFTGSAPYQNVFLRTLHPAFLSHFVWSLVGSLLGGSSLV